MKQDEIPIGFAMALALNPDAMQKFARLSQQQKQKIITGTHGILSKEEMHRYVSSLLSDKNEYSN